MAAMGQLLPASETFLLAFVPLGLLLLKCSLLLLWCPVISYLILKTPSDLCFKIPTVICFLQLHASEYSHWTARVPSPSSNACTSRATVVVLSG